MSRDEAHTLRYNAKGFLVHDDKTLPAPITGNNIGNADQEHIEMLKFFEPSLDESLREIMQEIFDDWTAGKLKPFVEGTQIGVCPKPFKRKKPSEKEIALYHNRRRQWARQDMLALRAKNNATMKELLAR